MPSVSSSWIGSSTNSPRVESETFLSSNRARSRKCSSIIEEEREEIKRKHDGPCFGNEKSFLSGLLGKNRFVFVLRRMSSENLILSFEKIYGSVISALPTAGCALECDFVATAMTANRTSRARESELASGLECCLDDAFLDGCEPWKQHVPSHTAEKRKLTFAFVEVARHK